eukprot:scaffold284737_cov18-Prasinocladus_malaysianus.AAC.1
MMVRKVTSHAFPSRAIGGRQLEHPGRRGLFSKGHQTCSLVVLPALKANVCTHLCKKDMPYIYVHNSVESIT